MALEEVGVGSVVQTVTNVLTSVAVVFSFIQWRVALREDKRDRQESDQRHRSRAQAEERRHEEALADRRRERLAGAYPRWVNAIAELSRVARELARGPVSPEKFDRRSGLADQLLATGLAIRMDEAGLDGNAVRDLTIEVHGWDGKAGPGGTSDASLVARATALVEQRLADRFA